MEGNILGDTKKRRGFTDELWTPGGDADTTATITSRANTITITIFFRSAKSDDYLCLDFIDMWVCDEWRVMTRNIISSEPPHHVSFRLAKNRVTYLYVRELPVTWLVLQCIRSTLVQYKRIYTIPFWNHGMNFLIVVTITYVHRLVWGALPFFPSNFALPPTYRTRCLWWCAPLPNMSHSTNPELSVPPRKPIIS